MTRKRKQRLAFFATMLFGAAATFSGCAPKGPAEQAGETIDKGIQNAKDAVNPPGPMEKAGRSVDEAINK